MAKKARGGREEGRGLSPGAPCYKVRATKKNCGDHCERTSEVEGNRLSAVLEAGVSMLGSSVSVLGSGAQWASVSGRSVSVLCPRAQGVSVSGRSVSVLCPRVQGGAYWCCVLEPSE